VAKTVIQVG